MAYTTAALIQSEFKSITFSATTAVTSDDVTEFISQEEAILNGKIGKKYTTPLTETESVKIMKMLATLYVKARILDILEVKTGDKKTEQGSGGGALRERADKIVEMILNDSMKLSDGTNAEASGGVADYVSQYLVADTTTPSITRTFRRDSQAW